LPIPLCRRGTTLAVENIDSAVNGVKLGLQQAGDAAKYVTGLAIYADWTTDYTEWGASGSRRG